MRLAVLCVLAASGGCERQGHAPATRLTATGQPATGNVAPPAGPELAAGRDLRSLPASTVAVTAFPRAQKFGVVIDWLRGLGEALPGWPSCVNSEVAKVDRYYMVQAVLPDGRMRPTSTLVFFGSFDAEAVAACASEALAKLEGAADARASVATRGELTTLTLGSAQVHILWATANGERIAVVDHDEALVRGFLSDASPVPSGGALAQLLAGVDPAADLWSVGTLDYAGRFLAVESSGYDVAVYFEGGPDLAAPDFAVRGQVGLQFASEAAAAEAKAALDQVVANIGAADASARELLAKMLVPAVVGQRLQLQLAANRDEIMLLTPMLSALVAEGADDASAR